MSLADIKALMRTEARAKRRALKAADSGAADRVAEVFARSGLRLPRIAALTNPMASELDPRPLAAWLTARGSRIAWPVVTVKGEPLAFREALAGPLTLDAAGLAAPPLHAPPVAPDLIFLPLLAFDRTGGRLGQGGGYYDRTLAALRAGPAPPLAIGLAYAGQEVERVPTDPDDQRLDGVLTEMGYFSVA